MDLRLEELGLVLPGGNVALNGVSTRVDRGERVAVIGPSGAGKTSLLRVLGTAMRPTRGGLLVGGSDPWALARPALRRLRARIGTVHQAPPLPPRQRVVTAVLAGRLGAWGFWTGLASLAHPIDIAGARAALARLDLDERVFDRCDRLSGGQLQRVGVARVLYQKPDLILADEPVSALDPQLSDLTVGVLATEAQARGVSIVASLHDVKLALKWFPRIIGLRDGNIAFDLQPARVTQPMLQELYASESRVAPTQDDEPVEFPEARPRAVAGAPPLCR